MVRARVIVMVLELSSLAFARFKREACLSTQLSRS